MMAALYKEILQEGVTTNDIAPRCDNEVIQWKEGVFNPNYPLGKFFPPSHLPENF